MTTVGQRFEKFLSNIALTKDQEEDGITKHTSVRSCLNKHYYNFNGGYSNSMLVGSWGKSTRVRPPRDIDVLFTLPDFVYQRYQQKSGNKQSQLLQEVKDVLGTTFTTTKMRADGQVVMVQFASYAVEVVPSFKLVTGHHLICDTHDGGKYKEIAPDQEIAAIATSDARTNGKTRHLSRMMKKWQRNCNVPCKSFWFELVAMEFLSTWPYIDKSLTWYDWMVRDYFKYLISKSGGYVFLPDTAETVWLGSDWKGKAETALGRAEKACVYEADNKDVDAWWEWRNIFGEDVPLT